MTLSGQIRVSRLPYRDLGGERYVADAAFLCDGCDRMSVATWITSYDPRDSRWESYGRDGTPEEHEEARWSPPAGHQVSFPDVPDGIAEAASEA